MLAQKTSCAALAVQESPEGGVMSEQAIESHFHYVYILRSLACTDRHYVGQTSNLDARLKKHNEGGCIHTAKLRPWRIETAIAFRSEDKAIAFEQYLKSHAGRAFAKKHL
jgi:putative endonuclease